MPKTLIAFLLGLFAFVVVMAVGEGSVLLAGFVALAVYCCLCQFLLSRKNADAWRTDWLVMLSLDAIMLISVVIMVLVEKRDVILSQGPGMLLATCGGTYLGAVLASLAARRTAARA